MCPLGANKDLAVLAAGRNKSKSETKSNVHLIITMDLQRHAISRIEFPRLNIYPEKSEGANVTMFNVVSTKHPNCAYRTE